MKTIAMFESLMSPAELKGLLSPAELKGLLSPAELKGLAIIFRNTKTLVGLQSGESGTLPF